MEQIHASCVAIDGAGVLIRGPSGAGKSDLALRLIDLGARLVADDRTVLRADSGFLVASAPAALAGRIEVRGVGIVEVEPLAAAPVALVVDLVAPDAVERMPGPETVRLAGITVPSVRLTAFEASATAKVRAALAPRSAL